MRIDCSTDIGAVRSSNQDACECGTFACGSCWAAVCDGMGGANGGNVASALAVREIKETVTSRFRPGMTPEEIKSLMTNAIEDGNEAVFEAGREDPELWGMGTTAVLVIADQAKLHVVHVGDSRAYLKNREGFRQITEDHSYVQDLVNLGHLTREQARNHPRRNIITRVLGVHPDVLPDYSCFDFRPGDAVLLCTDGLSNYAEENVLLKYMKQYSKDGAKLVQRLIRHALDSGGSDNITAAVVTNG